MTASPAATRPRLGLAVFFLVAFGIPWAGWIGSRLLHSSGDTLSFLVFPAACSLAGFAAALAEGGWAGLLAFARRVFNPRVSPWLFLAAFGLPVVAGLLTYSDHASDLLQGGAPHFAKLLGVASLANWWTGPLAEEFGWRGYLLERLCRRVSPLVAGLIIGPVWAAWHIPLFYDSVFAHLPSALQFLGWVTAWSVVLALLVARAKGSVLVSVLGHWSINAQPGLFFALLPAIAHDTVPGGLAYCLASIAVAVVIAFLWRKTRWQPYGNSTVAPVV
jgi:membrane protease YdiL (CAAX protease family)